MGNASSPLANWNTYEGTLKAAYEGFVCDKREIARCFALYMESDASTRVRLKSPFPHMGKVMSELVDVGYTVFVDHGLMSEEDIPKYIKQFPHTLTYEKLVKKMGRERAFKRYCEVTSMDPRIALKRLSALGTIAISDEAFNKALETRVIKS